MCVYMCVCAQTVQGPAFYLQTGPTIGCISKSSSDGVQNSARRFVKERDREREGERD